jgi:hypothetical protein
MGADLVLLLHAAFVAFVVAGGLLVLKWPQLAWLHLPAVAWGAIVEFTGWICPLTPLENALRDLAGVAVYDTDFIERYVLPWLYPAQLTHSMQLLLGALVVGINVLIYGWVWHRPPDGRRPSSSGRL